jgi:endonuclease G
MRAVIFICLLISSITALASDWRSRLSLPLSECAIHAPFGTPTIVRAETTTICREGFLLQHDDRARIAIWAAYRLTRDKALGCAIRTSTFRQDPALPPTGSAAVADYERSGFDKGHLVPNGDMRWNSEVEQDSNFLSNIAPQVPALNRRHWAALEELIRAWAIDRRELIVYVGPIFKSGSTSNERLSARVVIPQAFFKIVIDPGSREILAFIYPNREISELQSAQSFLVSIVEIEVETRVAFPVPNDPVFKLSIWETSTSPRAERARRCAAQPR